MQRDFELLSPIRKKQRKWTLEQQQYVDIICIMTLHFEILVSKKEIKKIL